VFERPIFPVASAAGVKRDQRPRKIAEKFLRTMSIFRGKINPRSEIACSQSEFFERSGKLTCGMLVIIDLCRPVDQIFDAASAQVVLKDSIRIVEIADDQIKTCEIICKFRGQFRVFREEAGERSVFDRANGLSVKALFCQDRNMFVTEDLKVHVRIALTQRLQCWQGENEIADRTAADHQN